MSSLERNSSNRFPKNTSFLTNLVRKTPKSRNSRHTLFDVGKKVILYYINEVQWVDFVCVSLFRLLEVLHLQRRKSILKQVQKIRNIQLLWTTLAQHTESNFSFVSKRVRWRQCCLLFLLRYWFCLHCIKFIR